MSGRWVFVLVFPLSFVGEVGFCFGVSVVICMGGKGGFFLCVSVLICRGGGFLFWCFHCYLYGG